jgi:hypothetical protein
VSTDQDREDKGAEQRNVAKDDAQVDVQVGVVHGDLNYFRAEGASPREQYRVGLNYLRGNVQQQAEKLICTAFMGGHRTSRVAYHWMLAILSGRSFDHLTSDDFNKLNQAFEYARRRRDGWAAAAAAISQLLGCLVEQDARAEVDQVRLDAALGAFDALPDARQEEIRRHLEMILAGGIQDRMDTEYANVVRTQRMSADRERRAWKFFEPEPTPPRLRTPEPVRFGALDRVRMTLGALVTGAGVVLWSTLLAGGRVAPIAGMLLWVVGIGLALWQRWTSMYRERRFEARHAERADVPEEDDWRDEREQRFVTQVGWRVDAEFWYFRPRDAKRRREWDKYVRGIKNSLRREVHDLYGNDGTVEPAAWLIRWYARQAVLQFRAGAANLDDERPEADPLGPVAVFAAAAAMVAGAVIGLWAAFAVRWDVALLALLAVLLGMALLLPAITKLYLERRRHAEETEGMRRRYEEQCAAHEYMTNQLRDRPGDSEMARWLDYDKAYARMLALHRYQLKNRHVIAHAVLSQGTLSCRTGRVRFGPPRYSTYQIHVFLLTERGVRQVMFEVNFFNGLVHNERRMTFHYGAVTALRVGEIVVRLDGDRSRRTPDRTGQQWLHRLAQRHRDASHQGHAVVLSRTFRLSLVNDETIPIRVTNFDDGLIARLRESLWDMLELALDVAGSGALRVLESVAAEGKDWVALELDRRTHRLKSYEQDMGLPDAA